MHCLRENMNDMGFELIWAQSSPGFGAGNSLTPSLLLRRKPGCPSPAFTMPHWDQSVKHGAALCVAGVQTEMVPVVSAVAIHDCTPVARAASLQAPTVPHMCAASAQAFWHFVFKEACRRRSVDEMPQMATKPSDDKVSTCNKHMLILVHCEWHAK